MKMASNNAGGIGVSGALLILFIALKLTGNIDWSWFWVLSPLWIGLSLWVVVMVACVVFIAKMEDR